MINVEPPGSVSYNDLILDNGRTEDVSTVTDESSKVWNWQPGASLGDPRTRDASWWTDSAQTGRFIDPTLEHVSPGRLFAAFLPKAYIEATNAPWNYCPRKLEILSMIKEGLWSITTGMMVNLMPVMLTHDRGHFLLPHIQDKGRQRRIDHARVRIRKWYWQVWIRFE